MSALAGRPSPPGASPPRRLPAILGLAALALLLAVPLGAATPVVEPLEMDRLVLDVDITGAIAVTNLSLTVTNPSAVSQEATLSVPLSPHAVVTGFTLVTHNRTLVGVVKEREDARQDYETSRTLGQDAVLLASAGRGLLSIRLNLGADRTVTWNATWVEVLPLDVGTQAYVLPLTGFRGAAGSVGVVTLDLALRAPTGWDRLLLQGLPATKSGSEDGVHRWHYADEDVALTSDLRLEWDPSTDGYASSVVVSDLGPDAAALLTILPPTFGGEPLPKDIVFVVDRSGSMSGSKIEQAREALSAILGDLRGTDRFGLVRFDDAIEAWSAELKAPTTANLASARAWVAEVDARGSTDIEGGLARAFGLLSTGGGRLPVVVLVTDGQPTAGITSLPGILAAVEEKNHAGARVHAVGIGFDQDDAFLTELAASTRGLYRPVPAQGDVAEALEGFYDSIDTAVLANVTITIDGVGLDDVQPDPLPDLYEGSHLVAACRLDASGLPDPLVVRIWGQGADGPRMHAVTVPAEAVVVQAEALPLWARQKASAIERTILLGTAEDSDEARATLRELGVSYQVETLETSWVIADLRDVVAGSAPPAQGPQGGGGGTAGAYTTGTTTAPPAGTYAYLQGDSAADSAVADGGGAQRGVPGGSALNPGSGGDPSGAEEAETPATSLLAGLVAFLAAWALARSPRRPLV